MDGQLEFTFPGQDRRYQISFGRFRYEEEDLVGLERRIPALLEDPEKRDVAYAIVEEAHRLGNKQGLDDGDGGVGLRYLLRWEMQRLTRLILERSGFDPEESELVYDLATFAYSEGWEQLVGSRGLPIPGSLRHFNRKR